MNLSALVSVLLVNPAIASAFDYDSLVKYTDLIRCLKPTICLLQPSYQTRAPEQLPINIHEFLKVCLTLDDDTANLAWHALRNLAWYQDPDLQFMREAGTKYLQLFLEHGLSRGITFYNMCPPTRVCLDPRCRHPIQGTRDVLRPHELGEASSFPATVFTHEFGPIPGTSTSLYCRKCHTRYYANYYVHEGATTRTYYSGGPFEFLHIAQHVYISSRTCELFATMMVTSWTSATNCARIYNNGLMDDTLTPSLPLVYPKSLVLDVEDVWNAFLLHSLLLDHEERGAILELNHDAPSQGERLRPALRERNSRMVGPGQEEWSHACDLCCWVHEDKDGVTKYLRSTVTDGVTLGHPCCGEHDCAIPLASVKDHFCPRHQHRNKECVVTTCTSEADPGHKTCSIKEHRNVETYNDQRNKAMFQLKHRLARLKVSQPQDSLSDGSERSSMHIDEDVLVDMDGVCDGKPETGNTTVRARFGRNRTHNEELCVGSCGMILCRATMIGSEATNGVRTFWMRSFPTKRSLPGVLWHDNNCRVRVMLNADTDEYLKHYFDHCALPVDVFHFKCKHKETDIECGTFCNPYIWPELRTGDGNWRFNSSAAEQANAWFGGFQSIVREMEVDRYNFFLDEMIKRRNRILVKELQKKQKSPYRIPRSFLLSDP